MQCMPCTKPLPFTIYEVQWCAYPADNSIGVDTMAKIRNAETSITIVKPQQVQYKRTSARYGKRKGTFSSHVQYLLVGRGTDGKFVSLRV